MPGWCQQTRAFGEGGRRRCAGPRANWCRGNCNWCRILNQWCIILLKVLIVAQADCTKAVEYCAYSGAYCALVQNIRTKVTVVTTSSVQNNAVQEHQTALIWSQMQGASLACPSVQSPSGNGTHPGICRSQTSFQLSKYHPHGIHISIPILRPCLIGRRHRDRPSIECSRASALSS